MSRLVKLTQNAPQYGAYSGEVLAFADDVAERLVAAGRASYEAAPAEEKKPEPAPPDDDPDLESMKREDLLALAAEWAVELPSGYVQKDDLIKLIRKRTKE